MFGAASCLVLVYSRTKPWDYVGIQSRMLLEWAAVRFEVQHAAGRWNSDSGRDVVADQTAIVALADVAGSAVRESLVLGP